ncbi:MAG: hypothetical protein Fur0012_09220 [Elusimicrobiota bacterium]
MKETIQKLLKIDRRYLFLLLTLSILIPIIKPLGLPNKSISKDVQNVYNFVDSLPAGSAIICSLDYDPSTAPELHPQSVAIVKHAFKKNLRVIVLTYIPGSTGLIDQLFEKLPAEYGKKYGEDYVVLPYMANIVAAMTQMNSNIYSMYNKDKDGNELKSMPVMKGVNNYKDIKGVINITGTAILDFWVAYVGDKFGVPVMGGVTAISQVGYGPYLQKGQLKGLIGGMKGAAEYETLIKEPGKGTSGIDALNVAHLLVLSLIIMSNLILFIFR